MKRNIMIDIKKQPKLEVKPIEPPKEVRFEDDVLFNTGKPIQKPTSIPQPVDMVKPVPIEPAPINPPQKLEYDEDGYLIRLKKDGTRDKRYMRPKKHIIENLKKARETYNKMRKDRKEELQKEKEVQIKKSEPIPIPEPTPQPQQVYRPPVNNVEYVTKSNFYEMMNTWHEQKTLRKQQRRQQYVIKKQQEQLRKQEEAARARQVPQQRQVNHSLRIPKKKSKPVNPYAHFFT